jgi:cystathionine beta-synthase
MPNQYANPHNPRPTNAPPGRRCGARPPGASPIWSPASAPAGPSPASGRYLKAQNPAIQIIGADPEGSVYSGGQGRPYLVEGIGEDFWPATYDRRSPTGW